jgi:DNA-binding transcriptional MerR regulator
LEYSISEVAKKMNVTISTLRYYDHIGLLPNLNKNQYGNRFFTENDIEAIRVIQYLKASGMQLKEIKEFMNWCQQGDSTLEKRLNLFKKQKENVLSEIARLQATLNLIEFKEWYYKKALEDGTEKFVKNIPLEEMPKEIQEEFKKCHC